MVIIARFSPLGVLIKRRRRNLYILEVSELVRNPFPSFMPCGRTFFEVKLRNYIFFSSDLPQQELSTAHRLDSVSQVTRACHNKP